MDPFFMVKEFWVVNRNLWSDRIVSCENGKSEWTEVCICKSDNEMSFVCRGFHQENFATRVNEHNGMRIIEKCKTKG